MNDIRNISWYSSTSTSFDLVGVVDHEYPSSHRLRACFEQFPPAFGVFLVVTGNHGHVVMIHTSREESEKANLYRVQKIEVANHTRCGARVDQGSTLKRLIV